MKSNRVSSFESINAKVAEPSWCLGMMLTLVNSDAAAELAGGGRRGGGVWPKPGLRPAAGEL